ncbi:hypothetical protein HUJ05_006585 [Dendroctonus ponderosae]|nr:hypothetical protein HUJ05_006585 [Dendroctonus ponderosae]
MTNFQLKDSDGKFVDQEQECREWERTHTICDNEIDRGPRILKAEVQKAVQQVNNNRTPRLDQLPAELLKLLDEESIVCLTTF